MGLVPGRDAAELHELSAPDWRSSTAEEGEEIPVGARPGRVSHRATGQALQRMPEVLSWWPSSTSR